MKNLVLFIACLILLVVFKASYAQTEDCNYSQNKFIRKACTEVCNICGPPYILPIRIQNIDSCILISVTMSEMRYEFKKHSSINSSLFLKRKVIRTLKKDLILTVPDSVFSYYYDDKIILNKEVEKKYLEGKKSFLDYYFIDDKLKNQVKHEESLSIIYYLFKLKIFTYCDSNGVLCISTCSIY
ncbi:MAG: hypothetical protein K9J13_10905 [Saprospiraceae bacterium]|nr:hypothetical protein [Saprospiraceae bacterium]